MRTIKFAVDVALNPPRSTEEIAAAVEDVVLENEVARRRRERPVPATYHFLRRKIGSGHLFFQDSYHPERNHVIEPAEGAVFMDGTQYSSVRVAFQERSQRPGQTEGMTWASPRDPEEVRVHVSSFAADLATRLNG